MKSDLRILLEEIAASLWMQASTLDELLTRNFLKNRTEYGINLLLNTLIGKGWIYKKDEKYFTYKKTVKDVLNPAGYELIV